MRKPKIIVCATAYHPYVGGAEIAIAEVAQRLAGRLDFFVLTARMSRALPRRERRPEATVIRLGFGAHFDKWLLPFLIPIHVVWNLEFGIWNFKKSSDFLLWGMDISQGSLGAAAMKCLRPRIPFVLTVQYGESEEYLRRGRGGLIRRGFRMMLARADRVTAISSYLLALARKHDYCGPAEIIPNGVDIEKFKRKNEKEKTTHQHAQTIITVSRLAAKNGIDVLIDAVAEARKAIPGIRCVIIGEGSERKNYELRIKNHGLEHAIRMIGEIPHEDIPAHLHQADIFVRPSRSEGMGNAFVEAMAAGLPVIGTAVGGISDVIRHEETGLLARPEDAADLLRQIVRALTDVSLAARLAAAGQERARRVFDWERIAGRYAEVFRQEREAKKRVVIATGLFPPEIGGPATYTRLLVDALPERGIGLRVVAFRAARRLPKIIRHLAYARTVAAAARGGDAIFAQDPVSTGLPAFCAARVMRKKFLLKVVGDYAWEQFQFKVQSSKSKVQNKSATLEEFQHGTYDIITEMRRWIERTVARRALCVIVPSAYLKGIVERWGVSAENARVIYNACEPPETAESKEESRARLGIPPDVFQIVSAGRLAPWKGFDALIEAMAAIRADAPRARLMIIGDGPERDALQSLATRYAVRDMVLFLGSLPRAEALMHLRAADLFVLNSSYEGLSHTLIEALAMEIPVMASDVGGNKEIITDGVTGRLYPRRDPASVAQEIMRLYHDVALRERFGREGKTAARRFSKDALLTATADVILAL